MTPILSMTLFDCWTTFDSAGRTVHRLTVSTEDGPGTWRLKLEDSDGKLMTEITVVHGGLLAFDVEHLCRRAKE